MYLIYSFHNYLSTMLSTKSSNKKAKNKKLPVGDTTSIWRSQSILSLASIMLVADVVGSSFSELSNVSTVTLCLMRN